MIKLKNIFAIGTIAIALASCSGSKNGGFELKGTLTNSAGETLVLEQMSQKGATVIDSVQIDEKGNLMDVVYSDDKPTCDKIVSWIKGS